MNSAQIAEIRKAAVDDLLVRVVMALDEAQECRASEIVELLRARHNRPQLTLHQGVTQARATTSVARLAHPHKEK